jgi:DNA-binding NarL/FixJ family response regulator
MDLSGFHVVLADAVANFRQFLGAIFASQGAFVVGETANAMETIVLTTGRNTNAVILDTDLGMLDLVAAIQEIKLRNPAVHIIVTSTQSRWREKALRAGADVFIVKAVESAYRVVAAAIG